MFPKNDRIYSFIQKYVQNAKNPKTSFSGVFFTAYNFWSKYVVHVVGSGGETFLCKLAYKLFCFGMQKGPVCPALARERPNNG